LYLEPEDAFGDYDADLIAMIPVESLPEGAEVGMSFDGVPGQAADGNIYNLTDIAQGQAVLDGNHPLAGIALRYEVTVDAIREASDEEIELEQKAAAKSRD
jgi:FKBP-type peptidyl-prolyl cis-trans isomerase SlyD